MLSSVIVVLATILLAPWWPGDLPFDSPAAGLPVVLQVDSSRTIRLDGLDTTELSRLVVDGAASQLRAKGATVLKQGSGAVLVEPGGPNAGSVRSFNLSGATDARTVQSVDLMVGFNSSSTPWASGSETRFGGSEDASWRLGVEVQTHLVRGLWDVLGYDSYDRGVLEQAEGRVPSGGSVGLATGSPWVATYPLFATNPRERTLLEWSDTTALLSSALADAITDYWDASRPTPPRISRVGWRSTAPWQPVAPRLVSQAEQSTRLALTFDGGASSAPTPAILKALREAGVHATMFLTADFIDKNPELVVQMARDGHEFGNHSATHPDMTELSDAAIGAQLDRVEESLSALTGRSTRPWFRPPFGAQNARLVQAAADRGYNTVMWTADSADWRDDVSAATVERRLLTYAAPGAILIEHLGSPQSAQVLSDVLRALKERSMILGTLSDLLADR